MKKIKIPVAKNSRNEVYEDQKHWPVLTRPSMAEFNPPGDKSGFCYDDYRYYIPRLGRWVNRDPSHELGGPNLYHYAFNSPINGVDPFGLDVIGDCACNKFIENAGITGVTVDRIDDKHFRYSGGKAKGSGSFEEQIIYRMLRSAHTFKLLDTKPRLSIPGGSGSSFVNSNAVGNWKLHIYARNEVAKAARAANIAFIPNKGKWNPAFWGDGFFVKKGVNPFDAVSDVFENKEFQYGLGCQFGTGMVMARAWSQVVGASEFNATAGQAPYTSVISRWLSTREDAVMNNWEDAVPGDWMYLLPGGPMKNPGAGLQGENLIYLGGIEYWGLFDSQRIRTREQWTATWRNFTVGEADPSLLRWRRYPKEGLDE